MRAAKSGCSLLVLAACGAPQTSGQPRAQLQLLPCHVPDVSEELQCGSLDVPEDRAHPERRHLTLPVIVLPALGRHDHGTPLFELLGGPGAAATTAAPFFATQLAPLRKVGDVVLIDQRGTGVGLSSLACPELDDAPPNVTLEPAATRTCLDELQRRADLRFYGTVDAARDLDDARRALGYERINLEALSYGTRLAQVYLRMYGEHVSAVVMFGTLAMDVHVPAEFAESAQRVTDAILDSCASDAACARAFPTVRDQLAKLSLPTTLDRPAFTEWIRHLIYSADGASKLPRVIADATAGDYSAFTSAKPPRMTFRNAVLLAITCSEDLPATDLAAAIAKSQATWFGAGRLERQADACGGWPRAPLAAGFYDPVKTDTPVLAIAGERDPVTPSAYAERALQLMPHAQLVRVPQLGHEVDGLVGADCLDRIELAFLLDPARPVDTSCVAKTAAPKFVIAHESR